MGPVCIRFELRLLARRSCEPAYVTELRRRHRRAAHPSSSFRPPLLGHNSCPIPRFFGSSTTTSSVEKRRQPGADFPQMPLLLEISPLPSPIPMLPFPYRCSRARALVSPTFVGGLVLSPEWKSAASIFVVDVVVASSVCACALQRQNHLLLSPHQESFARLWSQQVHLACGRTMLRARRIGGGERSWPGSAVCRRL